MLRLDALASRPALTLVSAVVIAVAAACGGGSNADATPAPISSPAELDSFRFAITMNIESSGSPTGSPGFSTDANISVKASGAAVAPDRSQATIEADLGFLRVNLETITVGERTWSREPGGEWTEGADDPMGFGDLGLNPSTMLTEDEESIAELQSLIDRLEGTRENVNERSAMRYELTQEQIRELAQDPDFADMFEGFEETLGEGDLNMKMWFDMETGVPLRMIIDGTGESEGVAGTVNLEFNVTDINEDISIEAPA